MTLIQLATENHGFMLEAHDPLVLYSTNTLLAYRIGQKFYQELHYVWCNPFFRPPQSSLDVEMPPSSTPFDIYQTLRTDVGRRDRHSAKVGSSREGLRRGAKSRHEQGLISAETRSIIEGIIESAALDDFMPLLYVIPFHSVRENARHVEPSRAAHPFSQEYLIENLPRTRFDVVQFETR